MTNQIPKSQPKTRRQSKGQRTHVRRLKQAARKMLTSVAPPRGSEKPA